MFFQNDGRTKPRDYRDTHRYAVMNGHVIYAKSPRSNARSVRIAPSLPLMNKLPAHIWKDNLRQVHTLSAPMTIAFSWQRILTARRGQKMLCLIRLPELLWGLILGWNGLDQVMAPMRGFSFRTPFPLRLQDNLEQSFYPTRAPNDTTSVWTAMTDSFPVRIPCLMAGSEI